MQEYAENVLIPDVESVVDEYPLNRKDQKVLCLFDVFAANRTDSFKDKLECYISTFRKFVFRVAQDRFFLINYL
jgi:hypothetical protein